MASGGETLEKFRSKSYRFINGHFKKWHKQGPTSWPVSSRLILRLSESVPSLHNQLKAYARFASYFELFVPFHGSLREQCSYGHFVALGRNCVPPPQCLILRHCARYCVVFVGNASHCWSKTSFGRGYCVVVVGVATQHSRASLCRFLVPHFVRTSSPPIPSFLRFAQDLGHVVVVVSLSELRSLVMLRITPFRAGPN